MTHEELGRELGALCDAKNKAYGSAFAKTPEFLTTLFPNGIPVEKYGVVATLVRMFDKMVRAVNERGAFGEDPFADIAGYALLEVKQGRENHENANAS